MTSDERAEPLTNPPPFDCGSVRFACYLRGDGGYAWRSSCGRLVCGRWGHVYIIKLDGERIADGVTLLQAMALGVAALGRRVRSAAATRNERRPGR